MRVWSRGNERFLPCAYNQRTSPFDGGSILVWTEISFFDKIDVRGRALNGRDQFIFMRDGARPHTANVVREFINAINIPTLGWPAYSQDLNPIEHLWNQLGQNIHHGHY